MAFTAPTRTLTFTAEDTATIDYYATTEALDHIYDQTPFLRLLYRSVKQPGMLGEDIDALYKMIGAPKNRVKMESGPRVCMPLAVGTATSATEFRRGDTLPTPVDEGLTRAESLWAYYTAYCALYKQDIWENSGPGKALDRAKEQIDLMYRGLAEKLANHIVSTQADVSASQKKIPGLQNIIPTTTTSGTNWGISRSSPNTWWRNNADTISSFATTGLSKLRSMNVSCAANGGVDRPDLYISTSTVWGYAIAQLEGKHRVTDISKDNELSSLVVRHMNTPWMYDDTFPADTLYMFNFDYLYLYMQSEASDYIEHPANPNDRLLAQQTRVGTGLTWGIQRPDRFGVLSSIGA